MFSCLEVVTLAPAKVPLGLERDDRAGYRLGDTGLLAALQSV